MKRPRPTEKLLVEEVAKIAQKAREVSRGLSIGSFIKMIRAQLRMSQTFLAKKASVPQPTISRIEKGGKNITLSTLNKILDALFCDLVILPVLRESIDGILRKQARKKAKNHVSYLKGTMSLEEQRPDSKFIEELLKQEEERYLQGSSSELWEE